MSEGFTLLASGIAGLLVGAMYFGGLWWTVNRSVATSSPALLFVCSFALRTAIAVAAFYLVGRGHGERLLLCLLGFVIARIVIARLTCTPAGTGAAVTEARRAP